MAKKILIIIAFKNFQDKEYLVPKNIFEEAGIVTKTISTKRGTAIGSFGEDVEIDLTIKEVVVKDFDAIIFIGGSGCLDFLDNEESYKIIKEAKEEQKIVGAICIAPIVLANAGILKGKRATVWSKNITKKPVAILEEKGAIYEEESVVCDGKIITASGPGAAKEFAEKIIEELEIQATVDKKQ
jgi:protease I